MQASLPDRDTPVDYKMIVGEYQVPMNPLIGENIQLIYAGEIRCQNCQRKTKKSYSGGFCFPCSQKLAQCDLCFMKPELCHFAQGSCREPEWGEQVCMQDHIVYLANSSGIKVGITRISQIPIRWLDQGATQALPIFRVSSRYHSGLVEVMFKNHVSDRTDWRKMLRGPAESIDLVEQRDRLQAECADEVKLLQQQLGEGAITPLSDENVLEITYPVTQYPQKISSLNFDKTPEIAGKLLGIKGQYLIMDIGVLNIRKFNGYQITMKV
ncbi:MAG: DUF2797 domain-containing protein [Gammaproteobacteria bacterium]|nr:DUF2797 domain-containing protein [Gammaproteobacteria bacterium]